MFTCIKLDNETVYVPTMWSRICNFGTHVLPVGLRKSQKEKENSWFFSRAARFTFFLSLLPQERYHPQCSAQVCPRRHSRTLGRAPGTQGHVLEGVTLDCWKSKYHHLQGPFLPGGSVSKTFPYWRLLSRFCSVGQSRKPAWATMAWVRFVFSHPILLILFPFFILMVPFSSSFKLQLPSWVPHSLAHRVGSESCCGQDRNDYW